MRFLYGIKGCSKCANRKTCKVKNDPATLNPTPLRFDHVNRGLKRAGMPVVTIETMCAKFKLEGEKFAN